MSPNNRKYDLIVRRGHVRNVPRADLACGQEEGRLLGWPYCRAALRTSFNQIPHFYNGNASYDHG